MRVTFFAMSVALRPSRPMPPPQQVIVPSLRTAHALRTNPATLTASCVFAIATGANGVVGGLLSAIGYTTPEPQHVTPPARTAQLFHARDEILCTTFARAIGAGGTSSFS